MKKTLRIMFFLSLMFTFMTCTMNRSSELPAIVTLGISEITHSTAKSGGTVSTAAGETISGRGVCWGTSQQPDISGNKTSDGLGDGSFESLITGLMPDTKYYLRAYAVNNSGVGYGNEVTFTTESSPDPGTQIIADHRIVNDFARIPQQYLDIVKRMWVVVAGESHSGAYRAGLSSLESQFSRFAVNITESGTPESYTSNHLRFSRATWGDVTNSTGWIYDYGEEDWYADGTAINRTKAGISYCNTHNLTIDAIAYGWCSDPDIDINDYLAATQEYIDFCKTNKYPTKVFFTTGTVDDYEPGIYGYTKYQRHLKIREYVAQNPSLILFDYSDILSYDDDGNQTIKTVDGYTFPTITPTNLGDGSIGHIGPAGSVRLAKAMWWMLARMAGWDGQ